MNSFCGQSHSAKQEIDHLLRRPTQTVTIRTDKDIEIAAPLLLTCKGAEKRLIARRRAKQVQKRDTWTTDGMYLGNRRKSRRDLR